MGTHEYISKNYIYLSDMTNSDDNASKTIVRTWLAGHRSCTLVIPKEFAKQYGLDKPSHVILERTSEGILIKKLRVLEE
jgi:hypothetical protein